MRIWTLHPRYLGPQGLVALWRETLLAQKVLAGKTRGYRHHPQLIRFQNAPEPLTAIGAYLSEIAEESQRRNYRFNAALILHPQNKLREENAAHEKRKLRLQSTRGQIEYEWNHLLASSPSAVRSNMRRSAT